MTLLKALLWSSLLVAGIPQAMAQANAIPSQPHLLVKGEASRTVMPDRFSVTVELESVDAKTEQARARVQANTERVLDGFKRHGAVPDTIRADNLAIVPKTRYRDDDDEEVFIGNEVSRQLKAAFPTAGQLRDFLAGLTASQEVQVSTARPTFSGEAALRAELKAEAAAQTRASAKGLAGAYGARITGLYSISDVAPSFAYGVQAGSWPTSSRNTYTEHAGSNELDRVMVTSSRLQDAPAPQTGELLTAAPIPYTEYVYAIFLIQDGT